MFVYNAFIFSFEKLTNPSGFENAFSMGLFSKIFLSADFFMNTITPTRKIDNVINEIKSSVVPMFLINIATTMITTFADKQVSVVLLCESPKSSSKWCM